PGITAVIDGEEMDTIDAEQSNREPQILSGYPYASDIAPNSISALFATNKKGTIYWAVSPINDGSVATEDLIKPPVYGGISVARGTLASPAADTEVRAAVTGLVPGGAYYLSAVMVDDRGVQSPTKVISFETPDNSVPAFAQGYPYFSLIEDTRAQIAVMPTKDCNLYYAVMPSGAAAPTEDELKTGSVSGALGYGVRPVTKNVADLFWVNDLPLEELVSYDLYLWLVDANGANKSNIVKLTFKTVDRTPPEFIIDPTPNKIQAASVGLTFRLNENGTVYWAVVPAGKTFLLPNLAAGQTAVDWSSDYAKLQVTSGMNAQSFGNVRATQNADGTITVSGLEAEKAYDFYYVAVDTAGNYSRTVKMITINSLDTNGPKFTQTFTKYSGLDNTTNPMVDTGIVLHVTENIRVDAEGAGDSLLSLYQASIDQTSNTATRNEAKDKLVTSLKNSIVLNRVTSGSGQGSQPVIVRYDQLPSSPNKKENDNWVIDYEKVTVTMKDNILDITFPEDALQLDSGATYYFTVSNVTDTSTAQNRIVPSTIDFYTNAAAGAAAGHDLRPFTTMLGQFYLTRTGLDTATELPKDSDGANIPVDYSFRVVPRATKNMENNMCYDLLFFTDSVISFDLYYRVVQVDANGNNPRIVDLAENSQYWLPNWDTCAQDANNGGWYKLGTGANGASGLVRGNKSDIKGVSLNGRFNNCDQGNYPKLNVLDDSGQTYYEFAISVCQKDSTTVRSEWSGSVNISVYAAAAPSTNLSSLTRYPDFTDNWEPFLEDGLTNGGGVSIGITDQSSTFLSMDWPFTDSRIPLFMNDYPHITPGDTYVDMELALDQTSPGSVISYVIAPEGGITPRVLDQNSSQTPQPQLTEAQLWDQTPLSGAGNQPGVPSSGSTPQTPAEITSPEAVAIAEHMYNNNSFKMGKITYEGNGVRVPVTETDLIPNQNYYVYFVFSNTSGEMSKIFMYKFTTSNLAKPMIDLSLAGGKVDASTHVDSVMEYTMATSSQVWRQQRFRELVKNNAVTPPDNLLIPEGYAEMTLLEALTSPYTTSLAREHATGASGGDYSGYYIPEEYGNSTSTMGYSVFDVYVRDAMKETIAVLIRSGSGIDGFVAKGTLNTTANLPQPIDETKNGMTVNTNYIVLTVAHHKSGSIDSFKAIDYVVLPDEQPPKPIKISTYIPDGGIKDGAQQKLYSGVVTIEFDKDLYWLDNNAREAIPVYATSSKPGAQDQWIDIISPMNSVLDLGISGMQSMAPTRTFILSFQDVSSNASFSIFSRGHFASSAGTAEPDSLRLTFKVNEGKDAGFETDWTKNRVTVEKSPILSQPAELVVTNAGAGVNLVGKKLEFNLGDTNPTATTSSLFATVNPNPDNYVYTWSSSNPSIASVSPTIGRNATVTAHTIGTATITVTAGGVTQYISVTVNGSVVVRQSNGNEVLENQTLSTQLGTPIVLTATPTPSSAPILWESSSDRIATVNNGTITTVSTGTATITVSSNGIKLRTFKVTITNPPEGSDSGLVIAPTP
ncbi:MAG: Ig-like domain-containing protein, partial [Oscillospiraceae bacterium]|nr:Ig-like domain-containing protein [Oscillospiraceae bacterium]